MGSMPIACDYMLWLCSYFFGHYFFQALLTIAVLRGSCLFCQRHNIWQIMTPALTTVSIRATTKVRATLLANNNCLTIFLLRVHAVFVHTNIVIIKLIAPKVNSGAYAAVISTNVNVIAIQEVGNLKGIDIFRNLLPGSSKTWQASCTDTADNALAFRIAAATITAEGFLFSTHFPLKHNHAAPNHCILCGVRLLHFTSL